MTIQFVRITRAGAAPDITFTVTIVVLDTLTTMDFGYHQSLFEGKTRAQVRQYILTDIKATLTQSAAQQFFDPNETVDLGV